MIIRKLELENWRSFRGPLSVPLSSLTLLIGPNNAGKSNLIAAIPALRALATNNPPVIHELGDFAFATGAESLQLGVDFADGKEEGTYSFQLHRGGAWKESLHTPLENFRFVGQGLSGRAGIPHLVATRPSALIRRLSDALSQFQTWRPDPVGIGAQSPVRKTTRLSPNGANSASMLDYIKDTDRETYERIQEDVRRCAPEIVEVTAVGTLDDGHKQVEFVERSGLRIPARHASEGLRLMLFVLLLTYSPEPPPLFAIEDLEAGLHPRRISDVVGFLRRVTLADNGPQVILTSHSPLVLDQFRDVPEHVIVVERGTDGWSTCTSLAQRLAALKGVKPDVALGDLWYSGVLGGVPTQ